MNARPYCTVAKGILVAVLLQLPVAHAQLGGLFNQGGNAESAGGLGGLAGLGNGLSLQSLTSGSTGNVAGLLEFCVKNNYLSGDSVSSVKHSLMSQLPGSVSSDSGYTDGAKGILKSDGGQKLDLNGGGLKEKITKKICDKILTQGKSML